MNSNPEKKAVKRSKQEKKQPALVEESMLPKFKGSNLEVESDKQWKLLSTTLHAGTEAVAGDHLTKVMAAKGKASDEKKNAGLQLVADLEPRSALETMLVAQMIQVNDASEKCMSIFANPDCGQETRAQFAGLAVKFQRTFTQQIEALQKLRGMGGQRVHVEHVHVNAGAQAIVGNVDHGGGGGNGK